MRHANLKKYNRYQQWFFSTGMFLICCIAIGGAKGAPPDAGDRSGARVSESSRAQNLVTGDNEHLSNVVTTTTATLKFYFTPSPALPGTDPSLVYPSGYAIAGQKLTVSGGGFTSAWILQIEGWDPDQNGQPLLRNFQDKIDAAGFLGSNAAPANSGCDLMYPANNMFPCQKTCVGGSNNGGNCTTSSNCPKTCAGGSNNGLSCTSNANCPGGTCTGNCTNDPCPIILGETGPRCGQTSPGFCDWGWQDTTRTDWVFASIGPQNFTTGQSITNATGPIFAATTNAGGWELFDAGLRYYTGTLLLPVPACCKGTYTLGHLSPETFAFDEMQPQNVIPVASLVAGQLDCQVGSCCTTTQCIDYLTAAECTSAGGTIFRAGQNCQNPPTTDGCCDCSGPGPAGDAECQGFDRCMHYSCVGCNCQQAPKAGWSQATQCCDANTGMVAAKAASDGPCVRGCSLPNSRGVPQVVNTPSGVACDMGVQCIDNEQCNGAGQCVGTPTPMGFACQYPGIGTDPCVTFAHCDGQFNCIADEILSSQCLKNRYISFQPSNLGSEVSSLRVTLTSLQRPSPPNVSQFPPQDFSAFEGQIRWVGPVQDCQDRESPPTFFKCAQLQCTPFYTAWQTQLDQTGLLHVTGPEIMPSSSYGAEQLRASCQGNESNCTDFAVNTTVKTARYGDCYAHYQDPSPNASLNQPNIEDVAALARRLSGRLDTISRVRAQMQPGTIGASQLISISDVASMVDAFKGLPYSQAGPQSCP